MARASGVTFDIDFMSTIADVYGPSRNIASMRQDLLLRRRTEIDHMNGAVATLGARLGIECPVNRALTSIIKYGIGHHVIVYSPFEGHVELGVLGGLSVEAQVRPFLNRATLEASQISLKPFFLSVAKVFP